MTNLSISLGVRRRPDVGETASKQGRLPNPKQTEKTLERDAYACRCCGFQSKKFQRVVPASLLPVQDGISADQFVTVCTFCELTLMMERAGITAAGYIIWLPELTQAQLNHAVRSLYIAKQSDDEKLKNAASRTLEVLTMRRSEAKKRLGTDDPLLLATAFHELVDAKSYEDRMAKLEGLRFLPFDKYMVRQNGKDINIFDRMLDFWTSSDGPYAELPVSEWAAMFEKVSASAE